MKTVFGKIKDWIYVLLPFIFVFMVIRFIYIINSKNKLINDKPCYTYSDSLWWSLDAKGNNWLNYRYKLEQKIYYGFGGFINEIYENKVRIKYYCDDPNKSYIDDDAEERKKNKVNEK